MTLRILAICYNVWVLLCFAYRKLTGRVNSDWWLYTLQDQMDGWFFNGSAINR